MRYLSIFKLYRCLFVAANISISAIMKKIVFTIALFCAATIGAVAQSKKAVTPQQREIRKENAEKRSAGSVQKHEGPAHEVQSRSRIALQLKQAKYHEQQVRKAQQVAREAAKEQH